MIRRMEIWILRHAEAEVTSSTGRDADRHLTPAGKRRMKAVARGIAALEPKFDLILTSPFVRARETVEPVATAVGLDDRIEETDALLPDSSPAEILEELSRRRVERALVVGHMPHVGCLLGFLLTGDSGFRTEMKKASLARLELDGSPPRPPALLRLLAPAKLLERLGRP